MGLGTVAFANDDRVPALGQGTWRMGESAARRKEEIATIQTGIERGLAVIDTAEMYGEGAAETLLAEALQNLRDQAYLISKIYPHNAGGRALSLACEGSLQRLKTDRIDLYLLHWRGRIPLAETVGGMEKLREAGKIRSWGVSNFDVEDMAELEGHGEGCAANQVLYNLTRRGPEFDLIPWMAARKMPLIAYSPLEQGRISGDPALAAIAKRHGVTPAQIALAWVLRCPGTIAIPKSSTLAHLQQNIAAAAINLADDDLAELNRAFPPPRRKKPLEMI